MDTAAIIAAPMLILKSSQPITPVTVMIGRMFGTMAIAANITRRNAISTHRAIPLDETRNASHWSRKML